MRRVGQVGIEQGGDVRFCQAFDHDGRAHQVFQNPPVFNLTTIVQDHSNDFPPTQFSVNQRQRVHQSILQTAEELAISFDYRKTRSRPHESFEKNSPNPSSVMAYSQTEAKDVRAGSYDNVLLAAQHEGHGGGFHPDVGREAPQCFARALIRGCETAVGLAVEKQPARRS